MHNHHIIDSHIHLFNITKDEEHYINADMENNNNTEYLMNKAYREEHELDLFA